MKVFYFVLGHPGASSQAISLAHLIKDELGKTARTYAIINQHPYNKIFNINFENKFDLNTSIHNCDFTKNILKGLKDFILFKRSISKIKFQIGDVLFAYQTMELPLQMIMHIARKAGAKVILLDRPSRKIYGKVCWKRSFLNLAYSFFTGIPLMKTLINDEGVVVTRELIFPEKKNRLVTISSFFKKTKKENIYMPDPALICYKKLVSHTPKKSIVIFLTDNTIRMAYPEINLNNLSIKIGEFIKKLKEVYPNDILYFKPHPLDKRSKPYGLKLNGFYPLPNQLADYFFYANAYRIKAVYSISSTALKTSVEIGIPSYLIYMSVFKDKNLISKLDLLFEGFEQISHYKSLKCFKDIGKIDHRKSINDSLSIREKWVDFIKGV